MKPTEVNENMVGKRCECISFGEIVTGTIEKVNINRSAAEVDVVLDVPQRWGDELFTREFAFGRFEDGFGPLKYLKLLES